MSTHPDFARAPARRRWTAKLSDLLTELRRRARDAHGEWTWVVLPHGALVSMRIRPDGRRKVRIARSEAPPEDSRDRWEQEVATFVRHLGLDGWVRQLDPDAKGIAVVFTEPDIGRPAEYGLFPETKRRPRSALER